jgi:hypothetical protein
MVGEWVVIGLVFAIVVLCIIDMGGNIERQR